MTRALPGRTAHTGPEETTGGGALVVGLGGPDRGDDAVGVEVASRVAALGLPRVAVLVHEDPTDLIELWSGRELVVVVDAVRSGAAAGTLVILETGPGLGPLPHSARVRRLRGGGTHSWGVAAAVELARVLGRLPPRLTLVGIEARSFEQGAPLSPEVLAALPRAVEAVVGAVSETSAVVGVVPPGARAKPSGLKGVDHVPG